MEQQHSKVSFSVGTKLLVGVVSLLVVVIGFLDVSTILVLTEDKRTSTYQMQSSETSSTGRDFVSLARYALSTLRFAVSGLTAREALLSHDASTLKQVLETQTEMFSATIAVVDFTTGQSEIVSQVSKAKDAAKLGYEPADLVYPEKTIKPHYSGLQKNGFAFVNLSKPGRKALLGILYFDITAKSDPRKSLVTLGHIALDRFGSEAKISKLTLATKSGDVLYDPDPTRMFGDKVVMSDPLFQAAVANPISSGAKEFEQNSVRYLGSFFKPGFDLVVLGRTDRAKAMQTTTDLTEKFILLGLMSIGAAILFAILFAKTLTTPLARLHDATKKVASGNFNVRLPVTSRDELGALSESFSVMSAKIGDLIQESIRKTQLESELKVAATVQQALFPPSSYRDDRVEMYSRYQSATECGGDWWGYFIVGNKMAVMIADATGHGVPSALVTAAARSCFSVMHKLALTDQRFAFSPSQMLSYANRSVSESTNGQINMTFFNGVIDFEAGKMTFACAGHNPPWLFKKAGGVTSLVVDGPRLGENQDVAPFEEKTVDIATGDTLFLYTDGVIEGKDTGGTQYGKKKLRKMLDQTVADGPEIMVSTLLSDFLDYNSGKTLDDDVTLASIKFLSCGKPAT